MTPAFRLRLHKIRPPHDVWLFIVFSPKAQIAKISGHDTWGSEIAALGDAKRRLMLFEMSVDFVSEPGRMTELEGHTYIGSKAAQDLVQKRGVFFKVWRKL